MPFAQAQEAFRSQVPNEDTRKYIRVALCVVGIVGSLILYGLLQERIMTQPYGEENERFTFSVFLVLNNRVVSMLVALLALAVQSLPIPPGAPMQNFAAVSVSNVLATTCQYEALKYVSFPVQTLGKCAKMIPVMIWGRVISQKEYNLQDYLVAITVMAGCTLFLTFGETKSQVSKNKSDKTTSIFGLLLMCGYLGFDGFTSTFQDKLFKGYRMETYNQMLWVTFCSACISLLFLFSGSSIFPAISFVSRHPDCLKDCFVLSLASTCGQLIILYTIKEFGALLFATVMTTRQFLSILLSCIIFLHPLTFPQWGGTVLVFAALYYQSFLKKKAKESKPQQESDAEKGESEPLKTAEEGQGAKAELPTSTRS